MRVALRETDDRVALAQGLVVGPAIWGVVVNLIMYAVPGLAGAVAGWIVVLALAAGLIWRARKSVRPRLRAAALFAVAALALFWIALASRQTWIPHIPIHLGLSASIRAGGFPPELPWNPGTPAPYHYGVDLLVGLLAPPTGPDLAFMMELMGIYAWISLFLVVVTALLRRTSAFAALTIAPLMLTAAAWGLWNGEPAGVVEAPVPVALPSAGLRASLTDIYWRVGESHYFAVLANVSKPAFTLSYALAFVVLARAAHARRRSWLSVTTLALLIGFLGLTSSTLAPIVFVSWAGLEAIHLIQSRRARSLRRSDAIRSASGLALAALLLLAGGFSTLILDAPVTSGLSLGTGEQFGGWRLLGRLDRLPGGVALLGLGPLAVAAAAVLLARPDRLVLALAAGTGVLLVLASLLLDYEPFPFDLVRLEGHARNFALFALMLALGVRLAGLRPAPWRYAAGAAVVALVTWPTIVAPVRNARPGDRKWDRAGKCPANAQDTLGTRFVLESIPSDRIAEYIRNNTAIDARVFSPHAHQMTYATGRPNASGFAGLVHGQPNEGPQYRDILGYLEPAAVRRLRLRIRSRARCVGGKPARRGGRAAQRSPPLRDPRPRRFREPLPRAARVPHARRAARARIIRGAAADRSGVCDGFPVRDIRIEAFGWRRTAAVIVWSCSRFAISRGPHGTGAVPCPAARRHRSDDASITDALAGRAAWRPRTRPRHNAAGFPDVDVPSRLAAAYMAQRRDRRLRARSGGRSDNASATERASPVQRPGVGRNPVRRPDGLHGDLRQPRA